jgi:DoxX-like family
VTSPRTYDALGAFMVASAVADAIPAPFIKNVLDTIEFPEPYRWIFAPIKAAAAVGLFSVRWLPGLARLTTAMLTLYFVLAVGFHARVRDLSLSAAAAATFAALFAAMTAKGPSV